MNEEFFSNYDGREVGELAGGELYGFYPYRNLLPDLSEAECIGDGADGVCFRFRAGNEYRVIKFGYHSHWRDEDFDDLFVIDVGDAFDLVKRLARISQLKEPAVAKVYEVMALDESYYFIVMEYLPSDLYSLEGFDCINNHQYQGEVEWCKEEEAPEPIKGWIESIERLRSRGFVHRDLHWHNMRVSEQGIPKFIDLESMCLSTDTSTKEEVFCEEDYQEVA